MPLLSDPRWRLRRSLAEHEAAKTALEQVRLLTNRELTLADARLLVQAITAKHLEVLCEGVTR